MPPASFGEESSAALEKPRGPRVANLDGTEEFGKKGTRQRPKFRQFLMSPTVDRPARIVAHTCAGDGFHGHLLPAMEDVPVTVEKLGDERLMILGIA